MIHPFRHPHQALVTAVALLAVAAAFGAAARPAAAKTAAPCWKTLINDWYDGRIDGVYAIHCYRDALKHLPADVDQYSSARDDIKQALQKRITQSHSGNGTTTTTTTATTTTGSGPSGASGGGAAPPPRGPTTPSGSNNPNKQSSGPFQNVLNAGKPAKADSLPIPLLVLGGVALLLMALGGAGFLHRRTRTRRDQLATAAALHRDGH